MSFLIRKLLIKRSTSNFKIFSQPWTEIPRAILWNKDMDKPKIQDTENVFGKKKMDRGELFKTFSKKLTETQRLKST